MRKERTCVAPGGNGGGEGLRSGAVGLGGDGGFFTGGGFFPACDTGGIDGLTDKCTHAV
jgi:hypothetical protein